MLMKLLRKIFIKDYQNLGNPAIRNKHGVLVSVYGIIANIILSGLKLAFGLIAGSLALISDSINNISDSANSIVSLIGFKMSEKPADKKHPFGHARMEYVAGLIISTLIVAIGISLLVQSIQSIIGLFTDPNATIVTFSWWTIGILIFSIIVKIFLVIDNFYTARLIDSLTLKATGRDALGDVLVTSGLLVSSLIMFILNNQGIYVNIDVFMGTFVSIFIIISGLKSIFETAQPLLGEVNNESEVKAISDFAKSQAGIIGVHDVLVHYYGKKNRYISLHVEVKADTDIIVAHELVDNIETGLSEKFHGAQVIIHVDPVDVDNPIIKKYHALLGDYIKTNHQDYDFHDLRVVDEKKHQKIIVDLVVPYPNTTKDKARIQYRNRIIDEVTDYLKAHSDIPIEVRINIDHPMI